MQVLSKRWFCGERRKGGSGGREYLFFNRFTVSRSRLLLVSPQYWPFELLGLFGGCEEPIAGVCGSVWPTLIQLVAGCPSFLNPPSVLPLPCLPVHRLHRGGRGLLDPLMAVFVLAETVTSAKRLAGRPA